MCTYIYTYTCTVEAKVDENVRQLEQDLNRLEILVRKQPAHIRQEAKG